MATVELSSALGMTVFVAGLAVAATLYGIDKYHRINLEIPYGNTIPFTIAVIGAGVFFLAKEGIIGLMTATATAIFVGYVMDRVNILRENPEQA